MAKKTYIIKNKGKGQLNTVDPNSLVSISEQITPNGIQSIIPGDNITVDNTDPQNPVVSSTGGNLTLEQARQNGNVLEGDVEMLPNTSLFVGEDSGRGATSYLRFIDDLDGNSILLGAEGYTNILSKNIYLGSFSRDLDNSEKNIGFRLVSGDDFLPLAQALLSMDASTKGLVGSDEFDKQGDRKAFAQIADVDDFYTTISGYDAGETQTLKHVNGVLTWVTD